MFDFALTRDVRAPIDTAFSRRTDRGAYRTMRPLRTSRLERPGSPDPNGAGAAEARG